MGRSFEAAQDRICNYGGDGAVEEGHLKTERGHCSVNNPTGIPKRWIIKQFTRPRNPYSVITHSFWCPRITMGYDRVDCNIKLYKPPRGGRSNIDAFLPPQQYPSRTWPNPVIALCLNIKFSIGGNYYFLMLPTGASLKVI